MKKFLDAVSCWDNYAGSSRYGWVEEIEDPQMSARLRSLSPEDLELLTRYVFDGYTQTELAHQYGISQKNIHKKWQRIKNFCLEGYKKAVFAAYHMRGIFSDPSGTLKTPLQAVISGNLNTLADGASVRPRTRRPPVRSISAS